MQEVSENLKRNSGTIPTFCPTRGSIELVCHTPNVMKVSKALLQTIAVAVAVATVSSSCAIDIMKPKEKKQEKREPYDCPACGLG